MMKKYTYIMTAIMAVGLFGVALVAVLPQTAAGLDCSVLPKELCEAATKETTIENSGVWKLMLLVVNILTAGAGILAVGGIVYGAILYTTAGPNQEQVKKSHSVLTNVAIGVIGFAFMYAFLQWLIPGGIFSGGGGPVDPPCPPCPPGQTCIC